MLTGSIAFGHSLLPMTSSHPSCLPGFLSFSFSNNDPSLMPASFWLAITVMILHFVEISFPAEIMRGFLSS